MSLKEEEILPPKVRAKIIFIEKMLSEEICTLFENCVGCPLNFETPCLRGHAEDLVDRGVKKVS